MRRRDLIGLILLGGAAAVWPFTVHALHDANAIVAPIHPKAAPAILTTDEERDVWMRAQV